MAGSALGWRPFATATDSAQYAAFASASGDVINPKGLAFRVTSTGDPRPDVNWFLDCQAELHARSGVVYTVTVATAHKCSLNGTANTSATGRVTLTLLRR